MEISGVRLVDAMIRFEVMCSELVVGVMSAPGSKHSTKKKIKVKEKEKRK